MRDSQVTGQSNRFSPVSFNHPIATKLDHLNFISWRKQVSLTIRGHRLQDYVSPSQSYRIPAKFLTKEFEIANLVNPKFTNWEQQDQLILSWLFSSMSDNLVSRMIDCETTTQLWKSLEEFFASQVGAKVSQYKNALRNLKKNSMLVNEFLLEIRSLVDLLALVGHNTEVKEHVDAIIEGLPLEYEMFIVSFNMRLEPYLVKDLESMLLTSYA